MLNKLIIHGYLGRKPELKKYQKDGEERELVNFSVGVGRDFGDDTDWFDVTMFGTRAKVVEKWFDKGSQITVWGRMQADKVTGDDGKNRKYWKLIAEGFDFCDSKDSPRGQQNTEKSGDPSDSWQAQEEDIPF